MISRQNIPKKKLGTWMEVLLKKHCRIEIYTLRKTMTFYAKEFHSLTNTH